MMQRNRRDRVSGEADRQPQGEPKVLSEFIRPTAHPPMQNPFTPIYDVGVRFAPEHHTMTWCPWDSRLAIEVFYTPADGKDAGLYIYGFPAEWRCAARLGDLPEDTWIRVEDDYHYLWPLEVYRAGNGAIFAVWRND